ncbi:MAG: hypothetical protein QMB63_05265 [Clostridiaceae bacterium]
MTRIELLFMEYLKQDAISVDEFLYAGLNQEDYYIYTSLCHEIQMISSSIYQIKNKESEDFKEFLEWEVDNLKTAVQNLNMLLSQNFNLNVEFLWNQDNLESFLTYGFKQNYKKERLNKYCFKIYSSDNWFRHKLEVLIANELIKVTPVDYSKLTTNNLEDIKASFEDILEKNDEPKIISFKSNYSVLQMWASKYNIYNKIRCFLPSELEKINSELRERFLYSRDKLLVYLGDPICSSKHRVKCVTAIIPRIEAGFNKINVNYCQDCRKFYILFRDFDRYQEIYGDMVLKIEKFEANYGGIWDFEDRSDKSIFREYGYYVGKNSKLSKVERQNLLTRLLDLGLISKPELINHLNMLINTNGRQEKNKDANNRWNEDLNFIREYKIDDQDQKMIHEICSGSKHLWIE